MVHVETPPIDVRGRTVPFHMLSPHHSPLRSLSALPLSLLLSVAGPPCSWGLLSTSVHLAWHTTYSAHSSPSAVFSKPTLCAFMVHPRIHRLCTAQAVIRSVSVDS